MYKKEIVGILEEIGTLLELKGENTFKIRAYQNGARAIESLDEDLGTVIDEQRLGEVPGIGKALVEKVETLFRTGELEYYDKLKASIPPGLVEMLEIPGFGPKKIKKVHEELGIDTMEGLRSACEAGQVRALSGFGAKSEEKILQGMANLEAYAKRHLWWKVKLVAEPIRDSLAKLEGVAEAAIAGSFRRGRETVGDIDFIVGAKNPAPVMDWFVALPEVREVTAHGSTKSSVRFDDGLQADLRVVPPEQFPFALHHFTGSKDHNVKMRQRALERGWSLSEWGLFEKDAEDQAGASGGKGRKLAVQGVSSEADLFKALDLAFVPPELREGRDEIEAAEAGKLPELVPMDALRGVFHNHTTASDGSASLEEMAAAAAERGWTYLGIADHSKASFQANGLDEERLRAQLQAIREFNESGRSPVRVFAGSEVDILKDGSLDFDADLLNELDYVVLSVHGSMSGMSEEAMTDRIIRALRTPLKVRKMLGHPTGRLLLRREGYAVDLRKVIEAAAEENAVIELNANPSRLDLDWRLWKFAKEAGVLCSINPDAHAPEHFDFVEAGLRAARKGWLTASDILNTRELPAIEDWLKGS
jgi:DNA polymerase (family 10)